MFSIVFCRLAIHISEILIPNAFFPYYSTVISCAMNKAEDTLKVERSVWNEWYCYMLVILVLMVFYDNMLGLLAFVVL